MKFCPDCGHMLTDEDVFCENCGARQENMPVPANDTTMLFDPEPPTVIPSPATTQMFMPPTPSDDTRIVSPPPSTDMSAPNPDKDAFEEEESPKKGLSTPLLVLIVAAISTVVLTLIVLTVVLLTSENGDSNTPSSDAIVPSAATITAILNDEAEDELEGVFLSKPPADNGTITHSDIVNAINDYANEVGIAPVSIAEQSYDDAQGTTVYTLRFDDNMTIAEIIEQDGRVMSISVLSTCNSTGMSAEDRFELLSESFMDAVAPMVPSTNPQADFYTNLKWHVNKVSDNYLVLSDETASATYENAQWDYAYAFNPTVITLTATHHDYDPSATTTTTSTTTTTTTTTTRPQLVLPAASQKHAVKYYTVQSSDGYVNMRYGPSLDHAVVVTVPSGTRLSVSASDGGWLYTEYNGERGWVHNLELKEDVPASRLVQPSSYLPNSLDYFVSAYDGANLRYGPSTDHNVIMNIKQGNAVVVVAEQGDWYFAHYREYSGWLHASSLTLSQDNFSSNISAEEAKQLLYTYLDTADVAISYQNDVTRGGKAYYRFSVRGQVGDNPAGMLGFFLVAKDGSEILDD